MDNRDKIPKFEKFFKTLIKIFVLLFVSFVILSLIFGLVARNLIPAIVFETLCTLLFVILVACVVIYAVIRRLSAKQYDYHRNREYPQDGAYDFSEHREEIVSRLADSGIFETFIDAHPEETYHIFSDYKMFYKIGKQLAMKNVRLNSFDSITQTYVSEYLNLLNRFVETRDFDLPLTNFQNGAWTCFSAVVIKKFHGIYKSKLFNVKKSYEPYPSAVEAVSDYVNLVSSNQLTSDDRMLLFYYLFVNKYLSGDSIRQAYDEFDAIFIGMQSSSEKRNAAAIEKAKSGNVNDAAPKPDEDNAYAPISPNFRMYLLDLMSDTEFDRFTENVFNGLGYRTSHNAATDACMIDFIAEKEGERFAVMAKTSGLPFDEIQIRKLLDLFQTCNTKKGFLVTTGTVCENAKTLAEEGGLTIWTRSDFEEILRQLMNRPL